MKNSFSVFSHSANYKFSLGSGSSFMVKQIIDAERAGNGKSRLEKEIQRIKKTPICGVKLTNGGSLPELFIVKREEKDLHYPNFNKIVHCVIPGPRIDNFENKVSNMLSEAFIQVNDAYKLQNNEILFVLPVIGINNFGYPVDFMLPFYAELLKEWIEQQQIKGTVLLWLRAELIEEMKTHLLKLD